MVLCMMLTPMIYPLTAFFADEGEKFISDSKKNRIQFYVILTLLVLSYVMKYWREEVCLNFTSDSVIQKCKELEQKLERSRNSKDPLPSDDDDTN